MNEPSPAAVVVPMFNEATVIGAVVEGLRAEFPTRSSASTTAAPTTPQRGLGRRRRGARVIASTSGQGGALQTGLDFVREHTDAEHVVTFDADGQHRVEDAVAMVAAARTERRPTSSSAHAIRSEVHGSVGKPPVAAARSL